MEGAKGNAGALQMVVAAYAMFVSQARWLLLEVAQLLLLRQEMEVKS